DPSNQPSDRQSREWDARSYHALSEPQFEWGKRVLDDLELRGDEQAMDAGCGTGRLTELLAARLPNGRVAALDRSFNMAVVAKETLRAERNTDVLVADLLALPFDNAFDLVFSTATFHWVRDHDRLFAEVFMSLRPGGRLHAQCGGEHNLERIQTRALAVADSP